MDNLRAPLARVHGLGSAKWGTDHFIAQRLTAIALVPLLLWFVVSLLFVVNGADYAAFKSWVKSPVITITLVLLLVALFHHAQLGLQTIIEDYFHVEHIKVVFLVLMKFVMFTLGTAAVVSVLRIAFGS